MMKILYVTTGLVVLMSSSAQAWEMSTKCVYSRYYGSSACRTVGTSDANQQRDYVRDAEDDRAKQARIRKWEAFCRPTRAYDRENLVRLVYAHRGCESGRSE